MSEVWVFGYGSLVWRPGFEYSESRIGYIRGYKRRFWQGNDHHRGSPGKLGRVVTLVEDENSITWGRAFRLSNANESRSYLDQRESTLGGYATICKKFISRDPSDSEVDVLVYIALPSNPLYLGSADFNAMASDIAASRGQCGPNVEYLARLATFMRVHVPNAMDTHLFTLEAMVKQMVAASSELHSLLTYFDEGVRLPSRSSCSSLGSDSTFSDPFSDDDDEEVESSDDSLNGSLHFHFDDLISQRRRHTSSCF